MKGELTKRQWALYSYLKSMGDTWTTQYGLAFSLSRLDGYYFDYDRKENFHDSNARKQITVDIRAINNSCEVKDIIITSYRGVKIANKQEANKYIEREINSALNRLMRATRKARKLNEEE